VQLRDTAPKPTEPTAAQDLQDDIVAMFEEAIARTFETTEAVENNGAGVTPRSDR
jgi:hypothetical protein